MGNIVRDFNDADLVYTGVRVQTFTVAGEVMHERIHQLPFDFSRLLEGNFIFTVATAFRRTLWDEVGRYDERFPVYEDWEFLIRATQGRKVRALTCCSAISRAFTGDVHLREHSANEADDCARCRAALQWKHRGLRKQRVHDFTGCELRYEWRANLLKQAGSIDEVITRAGHFIPTARGLLPNRSISSRVFATR